MYFSRILAVATITVASAGSVSAQSLVIQYADLAKIASAGEIVIGVREDAFPFSYLDQPDIANGSYVYGDQAPVPRGYSVDVCTKIAEQVRVAVGKPDLKIRFNTVTLGTRTLLVREGIIDMECGATSNTASRGKDFLFSVAFGIEKAQLISPKATPVSADSLTGKRVLVSANSTSDAWLRTRMISPADSNGIIPIRNSGQAFYALSDGKADAYVGSPEVFFGEVLRRGGNIADFNRVSAGSAAEPLAVMMQLKSNGLKKVADDTIRSMAASGEMTKLYSKWFEAPIRRGSKGLNLAMSPEWMAKMKAPDDVPAD